MQQAADKLKQARKRLKLTYRDVEQASLQIAERRSSDEYAIALSRLADIENKGTVPTIFRLYSLCAIYRLDFDEVLRWYGVPKRELASESVTVRLAQTHSVNMDSHPNFIVPRAFETQLPLDKTTFLSRMIEHWGLLPFNVLQGIDLRRHRYAWIGLEDWSMYPILPPGSLIVLDEGRKKIAAGGWSNEFDRPIYFLEHRDGYVCGWCTLQGGQIVIQPHPSSQQPPTYFPFPGEIELVGQVTAVAIVLDGHNRRQRQPGI
jgi:transcriptional regulator with XRE-family HTH domain